MKRRDLSILFLIAFFFQGCPFIASGNSYAPDKISLDDLQGCRYKEYLFISSYSKRSSLECTEECIVDTLFYRKKTVYKADTDFQDSDTSLANPLWQIDTTNYDTLVVKILGPEKDGFYYDVFQIGGGTYDYDTYKRNVYKDTPKGWILCKE
jgi:hypothetical protein